MSAPDTNVEQEEQKHRPALLGIKASILYGLGLLTLFVVYVMVSSGPEESGAAGASTAGSSMVEGDTEASALEGYKADEYRPGGNSTGTVTLSE